MDFLICKESRAFGHTWRLLRHRYRTWYYLERDGNIIAEDDDRRFLLSLIAPNEVA